MLPLAASLDGLRLALPHGAHQHGQVSRGSDLKIETELWEKICEKHSLNAYLGRVGALDCGSILQRHHGPAVDGLALGEQVGVGLASRLRRRQPLQGRARGSGGIINDYVQPEIDKGTFYFFHLKSKWQSHTCSH